MPAFCPVTWKATACPLSGAPDRVTFAVHGVRAAGPDRYRSPGSARGWARSQRSLVRTPERNASPHAVVLVFGSVPQRRMGWRVGGDGQRLPVRRVGRERQGGPSKFQPWMSLSVRLAKTGFAATSCTLPPQGGDVFSVNPVPAALSELSTDRSPPLSAQVVSK